MLDSGVRLDSIFAPCWLQSQILPDGYHVVKRVVSTRLPPPRPESCFPKESFGEMRALMRPAQAANPSLTGGYATLIVNVTRGIAEMYRTPTENPSEISESPPRADGCCDSKSKCCDNPSAPGVASKPLLDEPTPPFFPFFRVYLNDRGTYQTRVIALSKEATSLDEYLTSPDDSPPGIKWTGEISANIAAAGAAASSPEKTDSPDGQTDTRPPAQPELRAVYELEWAEEVQMELHSPASVLTLQLFEKDFCPAPHLSEDLLTSVSIPLSSLYPNQTMDLILNVLCTSPESYSLEALTTAAERVSLELQSDLNGQPYQGGAGPVASGAMSSLGARLDAFLLSSQATCAPTVLVCKIHVSVSLVVNSAADQLESQPCPPPKSLLSRLSPFTMYKNSGVAITEICALSLPNGPWTPEQITETLDSEQQVTLLGGMGLLGVDDHREPISVTRIMALIGSLVYALTAGLDSLEPETAEHMLKLKQLDLIAPPESKTEKQSTEAQVVEEAEEDLMKGPKPPVVNMNVYIQTFGDILYLYDHLIRGPFFYVGRFVKDVTTFRRPVVLLVILFFIWLPVFTPSDWKPLYKISLVFGFLHFLTRVHIPHKPQDMDKSQDSTVMSMIQGIQGVQMFTKPIEKALLSPFILRRLRILQLWLSGVRHSIEKNPRTNAHQGFASILISLSHNRYLLLALVLLSYSKVSRDLLRVVFATLLTALLCQRSLFVQPFWSLARGFRRYIRLRSIRSRNKPIPIASTQA